jgi:mRNA-degrading endonuclease RelE of RelBE toxin-antitoxin system
MQVKTHSRFNKQIKKLHSQAKKELDKALHVIMQKPDIGELKKGDLLGVRVYKFKIQKQLALLAYVYLKDENSIFLLSFGSHENFYRDLKNNLN